MERFGGEYHSEFPEKYVQRTIETMAFGTIYEIQLTEFAGLAADMEEVICIAQGEDGEQRFAIDGRQEVAPIPGIIRISTVFSCNRRGLRTSKGCFERESSLICGSVMRSLQ